MAEISRIELLALLQRLGSAEDAEVLAAARELNRRVTEANLAWGDLIAAEAAGEDGPEGGLDDLGGAHAEDGPVGGDLAADLALVDRLLAGLALATDTRDDLETIRRDIQRGDFTALDRKYLQDLAKRLQGRTTRG